MKLYSKLEKIGYPIAYDHFAEGECPDPPFVCYYLPNSENFSADNYMYYGATQVRVELYTPRKDFKAESKVEATLKKLVGFYEKSETWIESEKLYEVIYEFAAGEQLL